MLFVCHELGVLVGFNFSLGFTLLVVTGNLFALTSWDDDAGCWWRPAGRDSGLTWHLTSEVDVFCWQTAVLGVRLCFLYKGWKPTIIIHDQVDDRMEKKHRLRSTRVKAEKKIRRVEKAALVPLERSWLPLPENPDHYLLKTMNRPARRYIWRYRFYAKVWNCQTLNQAVQSLLFTTL